MERIAEKRKAAAARRAAIKEARKLSWLNKDFPTPGGVG